MKALLLFLCALVVGGLTGIWMDWSAHKNLIGGGAGQAYIYELQDGKNQEALLQVHHQETIDLVAGGNNPKTNLKMTWVTTDPCEKATETDTHCKIDNKTGMGSFSFSCSDKEGDTCPDPGVQQKDGPSGAPSAPPTAPPPFWSFVEDDFCHLFGLNRKK